VNPVFVLAAAGMLLVALAFVVVPILRARRGGMTAIADRQRKAFDDALAAGVIDTSEHAAKLARLATETPPPAGSPRLAFVSLLLIVLLLPPAAIGLYARLGEPRALDPAAVKPPAEVSAADVDKAIAALTARLRQNPDDVQGWLILGRAYKALERFAEAHDALRQAHERAPDDLEASVEYAETLALASEGRRIDGEPRRLLEAVLKSDPKQQRALWLLGIGDYQEGRYAEAVARWETLRALLPPGSDVARSLGQQIADARRHAGLPAAADTTPPAAATEPATGGSVPANDVKLTVQVTLDPQLKDRVQDSDTLFVFARGASGPPMPLAIQRLTAKDLPATVVLGDAQGMLPNLKLSQFPRVVVGARLSHSGNALATSGDLHTLSAPLDVTRKEPIALTIDQVVP